MYTHMCMYTHLNTIVRVLIIIMMVAMMITMVLTTDVSNKMFTNLKDSRHFGFNIGFYAKPYLGLINPPFY